MGKLSEAVSRLKESLAFYTEENISKLSDDEIVDYANQWISDLEFENSLYGIAIANNIVGSEYERWSALAIERFNQLEEGDEIEEADLLALLKQVRI